MKRAILSLLAMSGFCASVQASHGCLSYEPAEVTLKGTVSEVTYPGPPNFESIAADDRAETYFILTLAKPVCVAAPADPSYAGGFDTPVDDATEITLVAPDKVLPRSGTKLSVTGRLFHAFTGEHHTQLLLMVTRFHVV
jgi:hypothetical protein